MKRILSFLALIAATLSMAGAALALPAIVEQAIDNGEIGERADGYLGYRADVISPDLRAAVEDVNIQRRAEYTRLAEEQGVAVDVVARLTGEKLIARLESGEWYLSAGGAWTQK